MREGWARTKGRYIWSRKELRFLHAKWVRTVATRIAHTPGASIVMLKLAEPNVTKKGRRGGVAMTWLYWRDIGSQRISTKKIID
jgi:hypothetical protein